MLLDYIHEDNFQMQLNVLILLRKIHDAQALPYILPFSDISRDAAIALGNIGNPNVLNALQQTLDDSDTDVKIFSQKAIDKIRQQQTVTN